MLNVVVYKIYYVYCVDQSLRLSLVTSFVEQILPPWEIVQNRNKRSTNMSRVLVKERQALILFAS
jgi:hypothetical protein